MHEALSAKDPPDFSMVLGGPLYQLLLRARIVRAPLDLLFRRVVVISMAAWLPLLILSVVADRAWRGVKVPFLYDIDAHVRFLVSLPLLIIAEWVVHARFRPLIRQFLERDLITAEDRPRFDAIIDSCLRLRNSILAEVVLILLVVTAGPISWRNQAAIHDSTWYADPTSSGMRLTLPGYCYIFFGLPLFQFILLRWYFRLLIWCRFLWKVSRLRLRLMPTHPDGAGGLGFLSGTAHALAPLLVAQSALIAGLIANRIFYQGATLAQFKLEILAITIFLLLQALGPLIVFVPVLAACQRVGAREYGVLGSQYTAQFHDKWIDGGSGAARQNELLGSSDIQSLADLANSFSVIRSMSMVPCARATVVRLAAVTLLPVLPLLLTVIPLEQMVDHLLKALL